MGDDYGEVLGGRMFCFSKRLTRKQAQLEDMIRRQIVDYMRKYATCEKCGKLMERSKMTSVKVTYHGYSLPQKVATYCSDCKPPYSSVYFFADGSARYWKEKNEQVEVHENGEPVAGH